MRSEREPGATLGPAVAGTWYAADRAGLAEQVDGLLARPAPSRESGDAAGPVAALIAPHAGFAYSGAVAASVFRLVRGAAFDRVILLGPSHHAAFEGARLPRAVALCTPLGDVPLDRPAIERLAGLRGVGLDDAPFVPEHSLEAEIPFLQRCLRPGWRLVPVLVGSLGPADRVAALADALARLAGPRALMVVSSDFTHHGPRFGYVPFAGRVREGVTALDMEAVSSIAALDAAGFRALVRRTGATICGRNPIELMLDCLAPDLHGSLVGYDTSGRITGDWEHTVSYAGVVFRRAA